MHHIMQKLRAVAAPIGTATSRPLPVPAMARTAPLVITASAKTLKQHPGVWMGKTQTAVMLDDGVSNPKDARRVDRRAAFGSGVRALFHQRFVGRYADGMLLVHGCSNGACYCANPVHAADRAKDTVVIGAASPPPSPYTASDFVRLREPCLHPWRRACSGIPARPPVESWATSSPTISKSQAFQALRGCPGVTAGYASHPSCSHVLCGGFSSNVNCGGDDGVKWLKANGW